MANKYLDQTGLLYFWDKLKGYFVKKESGKGLSTNDLTDALKSNYDSAYTHSQSAHAPSNAEQNVIVGVQANGSDLTPDANRKVNIHIPKQKAYAITHDMLTITTDDTKGVSPYSTSYGYTNIEISKSSGVEWVDGAIYTFVLDSTIGASANRNGRIRIGGDSDGDVWHPLMGPSTSIVACYSYLTKTSTYYWTYKSNTIADGALHVQTDSNTTYAYLVDTIIGDATGCATKIDSVGYGARYSLIFPTTEAGVSDERWSSLVKTSGTGSAKAVVVPSGGKFYADRRPQYVYSANVAAGAMPVNSLYQNYTGFDLRYTANTSTTYCSTYKKAFLYLKDFNPIDYSFAADATVGGIVTLDKLATRFPTSTTGDVYLYFMGWTGASWYSTTPNYSQENSIWKYTPSTKKMVPLSAVYLQDGNNVSALNNDSGYLTLETLPKYNGGVR